MLRWAQVSGGRPGMGRKNDPQKCHSRASRRSAADAILFSVPHDLNVKRARNLPRRLDGRFPRRKHTFAWRGVGRLLLFEDTRESFVDVKVSLSDPSSCRSVPCYLRELPLTTDDSAVAAMSPRSRGREAIVWACIARDGIVLVESCPWREDLPWDGAREAIRSLLAKEPTLGWDASSSSSSTPAHGGGNQQSVGCGNDSNDNKPEQEHQHDEEEDGNCEENPTFRGLRFPVYEVNEERADRVRVWTFSCAYNPGVVTKRRAQAFLEKMVMITEYFRETPEWRRGTDHRSCQDGFGQIIQQRMEEMADPKLASVIDETLDLSAQIVKLNRAVLNSVRLQESGRCLDGSNSSSFSSLSTSTSSSSSSSFKQENWNPASSIASRTGLFKRRGGGDSKGQPQPLQQYPHQPEQPTDAPRAAGPGPGPGLAPSSSVPHRPSLKFVARSVAQREVANRAAPQPISVDPSQNPLAVKTIEHRNDERPSNGRSRTDSMEDFLQALEREACMPQQQQTQQPSAAAAPPASTIPKDGESEKKNEENNDSTDQSSSPSHGEGSPSRGRRRAGGAAAGTAASRAETMAILVVMMLSCLLATLPQSILKATLLNVPGVGVGGYGDSDERS
jgi:hypothetical protein